MSPARTALRIASILVAGAVVALPDPAAARPRIGLVLSGGGALGIAHIGVLEALEEMHVPVDVVAGTSMGAIVGGLYAAGYSPAELEAVVGALDWHELLHDKPDRRRVPFRRKVDDLTYLSPLEFGFSEGKLKMPSGLIAGHRLGVALRVLALRAAGVTSFDTLPIPFRAVATDLANGEMVVLSHGDLATALRASMAVPGVFAPVDVDGRTLGDGGVVRSLPVDVARSMGADIVIAVDLGQPLAAGGRPETIASVMAKTGDMLTRLNVEKSLLDVDVLMRPAVEEFGSLDFESWREILPKGRLAVQESARLLAAFALPEDEWRARVDCLRRQAPRLPITRVTVDAGKGLSPDIAARTVRTVPGRDLDVAVLQSDLERLFDQGEYESVDFRLTPEDGGWALSITALQKRWGPNYLRFGVSMFADLEGASEFNLLGGITMTRVNRLGAEFKARAQLGGSPLAAVEFYQPLGASSPLFAAVDAEGTRVKVQTPVDGSTVQYRVSTSSGQASLGLALGPIGELRVGIRRSDTNGVPTSSHGSDAPSFSHTDSGIALSATIDQIDNVNFPKRGVLAFVDVYDARPSLGSDDAYRRLDVSAYGAATVGRHTLMGFLKATSALGGALPLGQGRALGGLYNLSGLPPGELVGSYGGVGGILYLFRIGRLPAFGEGVYAGASLETGNVWQTSQAIDFGSLRRSASVAIGADTVLGPVYLAYGVTTGGKDSYYFYVGRTF